MITILTRERDRRSRVEANLERGKGRSHLFKNVVEDLLQETEEEVIGTADIIRIASMRGKTMIVIEAATTNLDILTKNSQTEIGQVEMRGEDQDLLSKEISPGIQIAKHYKENQRGSARLMQGIRL